MAAVALGLLLWGGEEWLRSLTEGYALILYGVGMALATYFHRSRVFIAILGLGLLDLFGARVPGSEGYLLATGSVALILLGVLAIAADRGVFSLGGLTQVGMIALAAAPPAWLLRDAGALEVFLGSGFLPEAFMPRVFGIPQVVVVLGAAAVALTAAGIYRRSGPVERGLAWCLAFTAVALLPWTGTGASSLFLMAGALNLTFSVLETSYHMAYRDELTGLPGRRALVRDLEDLRGTFTLAMADVDHFKGFNDRHGHEVGDQILKLVATCLARAPGGGKAYRYGGEEFTLVYPGRDRDAAAPYLEKVRASVEDARFTLRAWTRPKRKPRSLPRKGRRGGRKKLSVTVSIGMADSRKGNAEPEAVLERADQALYRAKEQGRNRVSR